MAEIETAADIELTGPVAGMESTDHCTTLVLVHTVAVVADHSYFAVGFEACCVFDLLVDLHHVGLHLEPVGLGSVCRSAKDTPQWQSQILPEFEPRKSSLLSTACLQSATTVPLMTPSV